MAQTLVKELSGAHIGLKVTMDLSPGKAHGGKITDVLTGVHARSDMEQGRNLLGLSGVLGPITYTLEFLHVGKVLGIPGRTVVEVLGVVET